MVEVYGPKTTCAYDNLRARMREVYYGLAAAGMPVSHLTAAGRVLAAYDMLSEQNDPAVTTFKGLPIRFDAAVPDGELWFVSGEAVVGKVTHIS